MPWVRTPEASQQPRPGGRCDSAFPIEGNGSATSQPFNFGANYPVHWRSGLRSPCLRFAVAVTEHDARLGTWLLAKLYQGRHLRRLDFMRLQGATLVKPDMK
jgi:hypothetical protein